MDFDINPRILVFIFLFFAICAILFGGQYLFPNKPTFNTTNNTSNVTIIYKTIEKIVLVTPTPDGHIYFASEYQNGTRLLQRPFSWIRNDVLGKQDMKVTTIVYDYKMFEKLHAFNPTDYKYDELFPSAGADGKEKKFLLIFVYVFMDDIIGDDTRMWAFNRNFFAVFDGKETIAPKEYPYQLRFKELEETFTFNNDYRVQAFKSFRAYSPNEIYYNTAGEYNDEIYYLRGGRSNAIDGFLIFEIDNKDQPEDILVLGRFYSFGSAQWKLRT